MYSIYFIKIETNAKLSFHCSVFSPPIRSASTTYKKDGATRGASACAARATPQFLSAAGGLGLTKLTLFS
jgi:hypothetical protein